MMIFFTNCSKNKADCERNLFATKKSGLLEQQSGFYASG